MSQENPFKNDRSGLQSTSRMTTMFTSQYSLINDMVFYKIYYLSEYILKLDVIKNLKYCGKHGHFIQKTYQKSVSHSNVIAKKIFNERCIKECISMWLCECLYLIFMRINIKHLMLHKINCLMMDRPANIITEIFRAIYLQLSCTVQ